MAQITAQLSQAIEEQKGGAGHIFGYTFAQTIFLIFDHPLVLTPHPVNLEMMAHALRQRQASYKQVTR